MPMKQVLQLRRCALAALLLCAAGLSCALTLGRARGAAVLGQPFQFTVPVQMAADEDGTNLCFDAEVFYGDLRQDASRVSVVTERNVAGQPVALHVNSRIPVDEPVVSVSVRSGCGVLVSRRYVLLADLLSDIDSPAASQTAANATSAGRGLPDAADPSKVVGLTLAVPTQRSKRTSGSQEERAPRHTPENSPRARPAPHAKLTLAPLDMSQSEALQLKSSPEIVAPVADDASARLAAAALWKSLNVTPEDVLKEASHLQELEAGMRQLKDLTGSNQRQMQALLARLDNADSQRYSNILVYLLIAAVAALVGALVWCWRELRGAGHSTWWGSHSQSVVADVGQLMPSQVMHSAKAAGVTQPQDETAKAPSTQPTPQPDSAFAEVDIDLSIDVSSVSGVAFPDSATQQLERRDFASSMPAFLRSTNVQEALDVRHQAEFFMTLGQYPEAIALLEKHVTIHAEADPWVYLDLLKALHTLSRKDTFDHYREEFNSLFTGQVPAYANFSQLGSGIESYTELCAHLMSLWPSKAAQEFIEKSLLRDSNLSGQLLFDVEAFKELLLLHAVLMRTYGENKEIAHPFHAVKPVKSSEHLSAHATPPSAGRALESDSIDLKLTDLPRASDHLIEFDASSFSTKSPSGLSS